MQVSKGFNCAWDGKKPFGERVDAASMKLDDAAIDPAKTYRVTVNNYLALGGDGFAAFKNGSNQQFGVYDVDALFAYFQANSPVAPAPPTRITRTN
jgi:5'-nucleotidase